jgi:hypothetical protein
MSFLPKYEAIHVDGRRSSQGRLSIHVDERRSSQNIEQSMWMDVVPRKEGFQSMWMDVIPHKISSNPCGWKSFLAKYEAIHVDGCRSSQNIEQSMWMGLVFSKKTKENNYIITLCFSL